MRKRERDNPCGVCGHYHKYEEGEVCGVCGHRISASIRKPIQQDSAFPSEILKDFLYLGSYDHASRSEILKTLGISHVLNAIRLLQKRIEFIETIPACQNLYSNSFTYHRLQDDKSLQFNDAIQFIEQCANARGRVLVHCMTGKSRSPAIVIAYLMKCKGWRLSQSFQWVKERRTQVGLLPGVQQQLLEFEQGIFGSGEITRDETLLPSNSHLNFRLGLSKPAENPPIPLFNQLGTMSIFERTGPTAAPNDFNISGSEMTEEPKSAENSYFCDPMNSSS